MLSILLISFALVFNVINAQENSCPTGFFDYIPGAYKCSRYVNSPGLNYNDMLEECIAFNSNAGVFTIENDIDYDWILYKVMSLSLQGTPFWQGIIDPDLDKVHTYHNGEALNNYEIWKNDPATFSGTKKCVKLLTSGGILEWDEESCDNMNFGFCEIKLARPTPTCANRWHLNSVTNTCIRVVNKKRDFIKARGICQSMGGDLAHSVLTKTQRKFVNKLLKYRGNFWIGVQDENNAGTYGFLDGRTMNSKAPFKRGMPRTGAHKTCVSYKKVWGGRWINRSCMKRSPFLCEKLSLT